MWWLGAIFGTGNQYNSPSLLEIKHCTNVISSGKYVLG